MYPLIIYPLAPSVKPSSMDEDDVLSSLPGLPSTLAALHQQHLATITTHTRQATMSRRHAAIRAQ